MNQKAERKKPFQKIKRTVGTIYSKGAMFLHVGAGSATDEKSGVKYELSYSTSGTPIIQNIANGNTWVANWKDLLALACSEGLDADFEELQRLQEIDSE